MPDIVFGDTETTGLLPGIHRPWEIALLTRDQDTWMESRWHWYIHPVDLNWADRNPDALDIGRFWERHPHADYLQAGGDPDTAPDLAGVWRLDQVLPTVHEVTGGRRLFAGSNPAFDMGMLAPLMRARGIEPDWHYHPLDVPNMIQGWLIGRRLPVPDPAKTDQLCRAVGVNHEEYGRHTAFGDCQMMADALDVLYGRRPLYLPALVDPGSGYIPDGVQRRVYGIRENPPTARATAGELLAGAHGIAGVQLEEA